MRRSDHGLDTPRGQHWTARALCRQLIAARIADPDDWYPIGQGNHQLDIKMARSRCGGCPVRQECRDYALQAGEEHGIWGGLTPQERRALARTVA